MDGPQAKGPRGGTRSPETATSSARESTPKPRPWFLEIVDWQKLQPKHAGRKYPWIRNYDDRLDDPRFRKLTKPQRADLVDLELLANRYANLIPDDPEKLRFMLRSDDLPDVEALVRADFVRRCRAGKRAAARRQADGTEEGRGGLAVEVEKRGDLDRPSPPKDAAPATRETLFLIPLKAAQPYPVTRTFAEVYQRRFPGVDVVAQLKKFAEWVGAHPDRPPAPSALDASITGWLKKAAGFRE